MQISSKTSQHLKAALNEDIGSGDVTSNLLIPSKARGEAILISREAGIFCGESVARALAHLLDPTLKIEFLVRDGKPFRKNQKVLKIQGRVRSILALERTLLNFLGHLSGIATLTQTFVEKVRPCKTAIMDTRKTTPLWRELEKHAVKTGGGKNHRRGLYDAIFVKENHRPYGNLERLQKVCGHFEIEVRNFWELKEALLLKPRVILFDNFNPKTLKRAVQFIRRRMNSKIILEASGGVNLRNVRQLAQAGVNRISIGALTHSVRAIDFSLLVGDRPESGKSAGPSPRRTVP